LDREIIRPLSGVPPLRDFLSSVEIFPSGTTFQYAWTVSGKTFRSWSPTTSASGADPTTTSYSYTYTGAPGTPTNTTINPWYWDDATNNTTETVSCIVTPTLPAGYGSIAPFTLTKEVNVKLPTVADTASTGVEQTNNTYVGGGTDTWVWAGPAGSGLTSEAGTGIVWTAAISAGPEPFTTAGQQELIQLITPEWIKQDNLGSILEWSQNGEAGLDTYYPYPWKNDSSPYYTVDSLDLMRQPTRICSGRQTRIVLGTLLCISRH